MKVTVHLFARARDLAGAGSVVVDVPTAATVAALRRQLAQTCPALQSILGHCAIAVNNEYAPDETSLEAGAEIALLPPVSGGCRGPSLRPCQEASARYLELHILELPKFTKSPAQLVTDLDIWLYFLRHAEKMDTDNLPAALAQHPLARRALEELKMLAQTDEERGRYEARRKAQLDYNTGLKVAPESHPKAQPRNWKGGPGRS